MRLRLLFVAACLVACGGTTVGKRQIVDDASGGGKQNTEADAASAGGAAGSGGAGGDGGSTSDGGGAGTGGAVTIQCGCQAVSIAENQQSPDPIAVDATHVYWGVTDSFTSKWFVMRAPLTGGPPKTVAAAESGQRNIAVDATSIYSTTEEGIRKTPIGGGSSVLLASSPTVKRIAVDAANVYWTGSDSAGDGVFKVSLGGGAPVRLATVSGGGSWDIAVDATHVYWVNILADTLQVVMKVPIAGGDAIPLAPGGLFRPAGLVAAPDGVYWTQTDAGSPSADGGSGPYRGALMRVPLEGGDPVELGSVHVQPSGLAFDGTQIYWGTQSSALSVGKGGSAKDGVMLRTTRDGVSTTVAEGLNFNRVATHGSTVCWTALSWLALGLRGPVMCLRPCEGVTCP